MDANRAKELLQADRQRTERLLKELVDRGREDRTASSEPGDMFDSAEPLVAEGLDDALVEELKGRLDAITRAEQRLAAGSYGYSVRSGALIPDDRLEADPAAELTVEEARQAG
jgi:DnaK suppressor protein